MQGRSSSYFSTWNNLRSHWYGWWLAVVFTDSMLKIVTVLRHFIICQKCSATGIVTGVTTSCICRNPSWQQYCQKRVVTILVR